jgi:transposase
MLSEERVSMSQPERDVLKVMGLVLTGERTQPEAARLLGKSIRQVRRIQRRLESEGDVGVIHRLRGQQSNHKSEESFRKRVVAVYKSDYSDFGPTLAAEKLAEREMVVSSETLRRWLLAEGLWKRKRRRNKHRSRRARRECFGEMIQADGSEHDWTEGRGETMELLLLIDDATNRIEARFYPGERLVSYFDLLGRYLKRHGRPLAFYADRSTIFQPQEKSLKAEETQFGRALRELDVELIAAYSPQAKGRVERFFGYAQDRWVKEMRLAKVTTIAEANALIETKLQPEYNRRFTKQAGSPNDAHLALGTKHNPSSILSVQTARVVSNDYVVRFRNRHYQLHKPARPGLRGGKVIVEERLDGTLAIRFKNRYLDHHEIEADGRLPGALPPDPRGLSQGQHPADGEEKESDRAESSSTRSSAVMLTDSRSGCSSAEPYPPVGKQKGTGKGPYRPPANHPWRRQFQLSQPDISIVEK